MKLTGGALARLAGDHAGRATRRASTSPSPTKVRLAQAFVIISAVPPDADRACGTAAERQQSVDQRSKYLMRGNTLRRSSIASPRGPAATRPPGRCRQRDERPMSVTSGTKAERRRRRRNRPRDRPRADHRAGHPHLPVPAVQHSVRLDEGDAAGRRLPVRLEIFLRLQPLSRCRSRRRCSPAASSASAPRARRRRGVPPAAATTSTDYIKRVIGLPGDRIQMIDGVLQHQRRAGQARARRGFRRDRGRRRHDARSSAGRRRCRTASATTRSIWSTTASTTTPRSTPCRPAIIS